MRKNNIHSISSLLLLLLCVASSYAQAPQGISYQAVARTPTGSVMMNQGVNLKVSILDGSPSGAVQYSEKQTATTNQYGMFTIIIGMGTPETGTFNTIPWANGNQYIKLDLDAFNTGVYVPVGTSQLLSVPYALYAETSGLAPASVVSASSTSNDNDPGITVCTTPGAAPTDVTVLGPTVIADVATETIDFIVSGVAGICMVTFTIDATHTFDGDLKFTLTSPAGTTVTLTQSIGGAGDNYQVTTFADTAAVAIASGTAPFNGFFRPVQALSAFNGQDPNGTWTLTIIDQFGGDVGVYNTGTLSITPRVTPPYSFLGETSVTLGASETALIDAAYSVKVSDLNDVGIQVSRDMVSGAGSTGTVIGYSTASPFAANKFLNLDFNERETGLPAGTYYYKLWRIASPVAGTENYSIITTKH